MSTVAHDHVGKQVYLAEGKYFVCSDVGKGRMQWYAMLGQPAGNKVRRERPRVFPIACFKSSVRHRPTDRPTDPADQTD